MKGHVRSRLLLFIFGLLFVPTATYLVVLFARGYRPNFTDKGINPTGLLVAHSYPDGANIYLDGVLKSATNTPLNLSPGKHSVEIRKDGYIPWKKDLLVEAEIVTRATAWLFPSVPSLKAITSSGATSPVPSPDGTKIAYFVPNKKLFNLYTLDLTESPLGLINRDPKKIAAPSFSPSSLLWSPDSRQVLIAASSSATLVDISSSQISDVTNRTATVINEWKQLQLDKERKKFSNLPKRMQEILASSSAEILWSPKEDKLLYVATASATIPDQIIKPLPGSSSQPENRSLQPGKIYIYDLEEDRNFLISEVKPTPTPASPSQKNPTASILLPRDWPAEVGYYHPGNLNWFPSSAHIYKVEGNKITITEYDGLNPTVVYAGPMEESLAIPYPSGKQILVLTNLNPDLSPLPNLYAVSLR